MLVSGRAIVAAAEPGKSGTLMGGGAADKASEVLAVQSEGTPRSEVEKRTDITPRFTYIYPVKRDGGVTGAPSRTCVWRWAACSSSRGSRAGPCSLDFYGSW